MQALMAPLSHRGPDGLFWWHDGTIAVGCAQMKVTPESASEVAPFVGRSGDVLVWDGRLDNRAELLRTLAVQIGGGRADCPDTDLVMASYERWGDRFLERLEGDFALALIDRSRHRVLLGRDAIGARPLFWFRSRGQVIFASEVKAILAHPAVHVPPNRDLMARVLLPTAPFQGEESATFFDGVYAVRPSHVIEFLPDRTRERKYWDFDLTRSERYRNPREYSEAFRSHFTTAVDRRLRASAPPAISLSGGLDSSSIYCLVEHRRAASAEATPSLVAYTYEATPGSPADELRYVRDIEERYGTSVERIPIQPVGTVAGAREVVLSAEGPLSAGIAEADFRMYRRARDRGARVIFTGLYGDQVLTDETYVADLVDDFALLTALRHVREFPRWNTDADPASFVQAFRSTLVRAHVPASMMPAARTIRARARPPQRPWYDPAFTGIAQSITPQSVLSRRAFVSRHARTLYGDVRSYLWRASFERFNIGASRYQLEAANPFLDRDLISFLMAIPGAAINDGGVPKAIMREALREELPGSIAGRRWKADFSHEVVGGLLAGWEAIEDIVGRPDRIEQHGISDQLRIAPQLAHWRRAITEGDVVAARRLQEVLALELWFRAFEPAV